MSGNRARARLCLAVLALLTGAACSAETTPDAGPTSSAPTATSTTEPAATSCTAPTYTVEYPEPWATNAPQEGAPCRWFHPEPFDLPENSEAVGIAIHLRYDAVDYETVTNPENRSEDVIGVEQKQVDGRQAVRMHTRSRGDGLLDAGVEIVSWYADTGSYTFAAATTGAAEGGFEANVGVLDQMMGSLKFTSDPCSAVEQPSPPDAPADLPRAVAEMRRQIFDAARACDYARLAELAGQGSRDFTFSFGGGTDPAAYWRTQEQRGQDPLGKLAALLALSHAERETEGAVQYLWPAAFGYESWSDVPEAARAELFRVYTSDEIESFERAGAYLGYRVGIAEDGEWLFFVAGD